MAKYIKAGVYKATYHKKQPTTIEGGKDVDLYIRRTKTSTGKTYSEELIAVPRGANLGSSEAKLLETRKGGKTDVGGLRKELKNKMGTSKEAMTELARKYKKFTDMAYEGNPFYDKYGKTADLRDLTGEDLEKIRKGESEDGSFEDFLRYGLGVKEDKIKNYTEGGDWEVGGIPTSMNAEDLEEWSSGKKENFEFDAGKIKVISGETGENQFPEQGEDVSSEEFQYKELEEEEAFTEAEDKRFDYIDQLSAEDGYTGDVKEIMKDSLRAIRKQEKDARDIYRDASTEGGGYTDMLNELMSTFERGASELNIDKESALKDLLQEYESGAGEQRELYTEGIGKSIEDEKALQAATGLEREGESISDIVKGYMPDFEKQLESYQQATGDTTEDIMRNYSTLKTDWEEDVLAEERKVEDAWKTFQESIYDPHMGTDLLTDLLSGEGGYYDALEEEIGAITDINASNVYDWYGS